jgi:predicted ribosome quality control (RQC) complex YloA/Tae2 family protein
MKKVRIVLALMVVLAMCQPAMAEFYRYVDKHGNVLYTDDLSKVPADQRERVQPYETSKSTPDAAVEQVPSQPERAGAGKDDIEAMERERERLENMERSLNQEYEALMQERNTLDEEQQNAVTPEQIKAHNEKIVDFNARIQAYENNRNAYSDQVKAFNERVTAQQSE